MISFANTKLFKQLKLMVNNAYLFYSADQLLNEGIALTWAKMLVCENSTACGSCPACKQFDSNTHPDVNIIKQSSVKVEDVSKIINKLATKPISAKYKIFVILDAENINEIAQNKLLKSLEEPNPSTIFILTSTKTDKLLPTVLSRLNKQFVPAPDKDDKIAISNLYMHDGIDISNYPNTDCSLTEAVNLATNQTYTDTIEEIFNLLFSLNTTADIPRAVSGLEKFDKTIFFACMQDIFLSVLTGKNKYGNNIEKLKKLYNNQAISHIVPLINEAYIKQMSNVNFTYILDNLLFDILKERFLCK